MMQSERAFSEVLDTRQRALYFDVPHADFETPQPVVSPAHYLLVIYRQKWKMMAFVALCVLATFLIAARLTPIYEATAKIDVDRRMPIGVLGQGAEQGVSGDDDTFMTTQTQLIQCDEVLRPVAEKFDLLDKESQLAKLSVESARRKTDAPVFLRNLKVDRPINTYILEISYRSPDSQLAADVANAIAQSYLEHSFKIRMQSWGALSVSMEKQLEELRAKMERSGLALAKFERELNVINPENRTNILAARLLQLNTEYTTAQGDRVRKEAAFRSLESGTLAAAEVSGQGEELEGLQERQNQAKQHLASVASVYGPAHQEYRKAANDLVEVQRQFEETRRNVAQRVETDYRQAQTREDMLRKEVASTKSEYDELNSRYFEYQQLKREADTDRTLYSDLERHIKEEGINSGFQNNSIRIADLARPPADPVYPRKTLSVLLAFILSSIVAVCAAILTDVLDNSIRDPEQAARALETSVLGSLPTVKEMRRLLNPSEANLLISDVDAPLEVQAPGDAQSQPRERRIHKLSQRYPLRGGYQGISSYEEAIRTLRHSILLPDSHRDLKSLLITSAAPGEGKSTAIIHLAIAHSEQGKRTLVIDCDLRKPSIHKKLNLNNGKGLSNALLGEVNWKAALSTVDRWPALDVLPAGTGARRASDLVGAMMVEILDEAAREYDLVFVDAPPLVGFAEAMQVAKAVDGVVVLARAGQTSRRAVATVLATLKRLRANTLGLVLNEVDKHSTHGYYSYDDYRSYFNAGVPEAGKRVGA